MNPAWSPDRARLVYHTPEEGDPVFIADRNGNNPRQIHVDKPGVHNHHLTWSPDGRFIYFVKGSSDRRNGPVALRRPRRRRDGGARTDQPPQFACGVSDLAHSHHCVVLGDR